MQIISEAMTQSCKQGNALTNPKCDICNITFVRMEYMNTHMKVKHDESEYMRMERLKQGIETVVNKKPQNVIIISGERVKIKDCTECGLLFVSENEYKTHLTNSHMKSNYEKRPVGDKEVILTLTADLTEALINIPIPDEDIVTIDKAEKEFLKNIQKF